jgi:hypothetical protein
MKLAELSPWWFAENAFAFRCPHCQKIWLTCTIVATPRRKQIEDALKAFDDSTWVPCEPTVGWKLKDGNRFFETMSITPSLDASKSGHWHGHITAGEIA